jgi:hypothetical protein
MTSTPTTTSRTIALALTLLAVSGARAQSDTEHNHLECFRLTGGRSLRQTVAVQTQFGVQNQVMVLRAALLCTPAKKTGTTGTDPVPPTAVPDFTCYKVKPSTLRVDELLTDQFESGTFGISAERLLCAPTLVGSAGGPTTTSTTVPASPTTTSVPAPSTTSTTVTTTTSTSVTSSTGPTTTTVVTATTSTTIGSGGFSHLNLTLAVATANCGGAGLSSPPAAPLSGELDDGTGAKIVDLGLGCLYFGGGNNTAVPGAGLPDGSTSVFDVTGTSGSSLTLAGHAGPPTGCTKAAGPTKHCGKASATTCNADTDCGSNAPCLADANCYFGAPLPVPNPTSPGVSSCVLNVVNTDASGTVDSAAGTSSLTLPLSSRVYLTGTAYDDNSTTAIEACPRCLNGTCNGGKRSGLACAVSGSKQTSIDCPPTDAQFIAPLSIPLVAGSGDATATNAAGTFCPSQGHAGAFGKTTARTIREHGGAAGSLAGGAQQPSQLAATFCVPKTGNALIDPVADLPGPGATAVPALLQLQ